MIRLALIDRDGVINRDLPESVRSPERLEMLPGSAAAVARLNRAGILTALVTNQSIVGRGVIDPAMLEAIHARMVAALAAEGGRFDAIYVAPDAPEAATERRKPGPGMLLEALARFQCRPDQAVMIGDAERDAIAALRAGVPFRLVLSGKDRSVAAPCAGVHADLAEAVEALLA